MALWIKTYKGKLYEGHEDCVNSIWDCTCSVCGWRTGQQGTRFQYCPICGTHMENAIDGDVVALEDVKKMMAELDTLPMITLKDKDGECDVFFSVSRVFKIINKLLNEDEENGE